MDYKELYERHKYLADMAKEVSEYSWSKLLEAADRAIAAEIENEKLRQDIAYLMSGIPRTPRECYACGSVDVTTPWFLPKGVRGAGFGIQTVFVMVWYCSKHEPKMEQ